MLIPLFHNLTECTMGPMQKNLFRRARFPAKCKIKTS